MCKDYVHRYGIDLLFLCLSFKDENLYIWQSINFFIRPGIKKNFGSGQLIFENWSSGPVDLFSFFFLNHNINLPNLIFQ